MNNTSDDGTGGTANTNSNNNNVHGNNNSNEQHQEQEQQQEETYATIVASSLGGGGDVSQQPSSSSGGLPPMSSPLIKTSRSRFSSFVRALHDAENHESTTEDDDDDDDDDDDEDDENDDEDDDGYDGDINDNDTEEEAENVRHQQQQTTTSFKLKEQKQPISSSSSSSSVAHASPPSISVTSTTGHDQTPIEHVDNHDKNTPTTATTNESSSIGLHTAQPPPPIITPTHSTTPIHTTTTTANASTNTCPNVNGVMTSPCASPMTHNPNSLLTTTTSTTNTNTTAATNNNSNLVSNNISSPNISNGNGGINGNNNGCMSPATSTASTRRSIQENWPWIELRRYIEGESLNIDEGNRLDFKLTVFSDYLNYNKTVTVPSGTSSKKKKAGGGGGGSGNVSLLGTGSGLASSSGNDAFDFIDYSKLGLRMTEYLIAFLNSNGGCLLFGVSDDSIVVGMKLTDKQRDKIRLVFDNCIRNFSVTPQPVTGVDYRLEFLPVIPKALKDRVNELTDAEFNKLATSKVVLALEVRKSKLFHYAHISKQLKSWERLNASNVCLNEHPFRFVKRLQELKSGNRFYDCAFEDHQQNIVLNEDEIAERYITLLFSDIVLYCSEKIMASRGLNTRMYRLEEWSILDDKGRFIIDRPSKYFKWLYDYLQIGMITVPISEYFILVAEANFYNIHELVPNSCSALPNKAVKRVTGDYVTLITPSLAATTASLLDEPTNCPTESPPPPPPPGPEPTKTKSAGSVRFE